MILIHEFSAEEFLGRTVMNCRDAGALRERVQR
jgi:hypothetical protein